METTDTPTAFPSRGWALFLLGGSASGKTTFIEREHFPFRGRVLSADRLSDLVMRVHNHASCYYRRYPALFEQVEQIVRAGLNAHNRYLAPQDEQRWPQNIHLTYDTNYLLERSMATLLSNCVHSSYGREAYFRGCIERMRPKMGNLIFDMTGDKNSVSHYIPMLREAGYRILVIWVVANRNCALIWNRYRRRRMKDSAVHLGHNAPNGFLPEYLKGAAGTEVDRAMLVFNSTESFRREMTAEEYASRCIELSKVDGRFVIPSEVEARLMRVLGKMEDNPLGNNGVESDEPVWQTDAKGREMIIDENFIARYTAEVTMDDGRTIRALYKLDCKGGIVLEKDRKTPKFLSPEKWDPYYPYIPVREEDLGCKVCRRERGGAIKYRKIRLPRTYIDPRSMNKIFRRVAQYNLLAEERGLPQVSIRDLAESFESEQKSCFEKSLSCLYVSAGMKEPPLPQMPREVYDVNPPCRVQFLSGEEYVRAVADYDRSHRQYEENLREWQEYCRTTDCQPIKE